MASSTKPWPRSTGPSTCGGWIGDSLHAVPAPERSQEPVTRAPILAAALLALAVPAHAAEPYVAAQVGSVVSTATSNDDELEHGSERAWSFGLAAGARFGVTSRVRARIELEASTRAHE